ncbi:hypothetical protein [Halotia branconii]|uniref:Uncharacterized protein n=1 Tax=Halotia branconii CENA392 TaxID=1539056 RepID=A0AAJ6PBK7_9CYAN|nr:hypothetical protein [Halotia branconii]WGV28034.1 hypothetical protein QI031_11370 [Halotia branconii CENA392]
MSVNYLESDRTLTSDYQSFSGLPFAKRQGIAYIYFSNLSNSSDRCW